jgi:hypothetical protein
LIQFLKSNDSIGGIYENENSSKIEGIGLVQVLIKDGLMHTLLDVQHILDMKRNLISLSALESKGYSFSGRDGVLRIFHDQFVLSKDIRRENLSGQKLRTEIIKIADRNNGVCSLIRSDKKVQILRTAIFEAGSANLQF